MQKSLSKYGFLLLLLLSGLNSVSQTGLISDFQIIEKNRIENLSPKKDIRPFIYSEKTSPLVKYNPINLVFGGLLFLYQNTLSQQFSATCLYEPSCSEFSKQSIRKYGLLKGIFLSADRITRCNRIAATGIHPLRVENNKVADPIDFYQLRK